MKKNCFSLTELVVVIVSIVILSAVLLPAINAAQGDARTTACQGNLKALAVAEEMYMDNNDGNFTPTYVPKFIPSWTVNGKTSRSKTYAKWPYFMLQAGKLLPGGSDGWQLPKEFHCPMRTKSRFSSFQYDCYAKLDYGMNYAFAPKDSNGVYQNIVHVENAAAQIIFADAKQLSWPDDTGSYEFPCFVSKQGTWGKPDKLAAMDENVYLGHAGANVCYVDGHVALIPVAQGNTPAGRKAFWTTTYCGKTNAWCVRKFGK